MKIYISYIKRLLSLLNCSIYESGLIFFGSSELFLNCFEKVK